MPPNPNTPTGPKGSKIDVNLSLLGTQSGAHFENFVKQLEAISSQLRAATELSSQRGLEAHQQVAQTFSSGSPSASRAGAPAPYDPGPGPDASHGNQAYENRAKIDRTFRSMVGDVWRSGREGFREGGFSGAYVGAGNEWLEGKRSPRWDESQQHEDYYNAAGLTPPRAAAGGRGGGGGGPSRPPAPPGPGEPPDGEEPLSDLEWRRHVSGDPGPLQLPRFGEFTIQDTLRAMSEKAEDYAIRKEHRTGRPADVAGTTAGLLAQAAESSPYYSMVLGRAQGWIQRAGLQGLGPQNAQALGTSLGYARGGVDVNGPFGIGFQVPGSQYFSEAGQKGLEQTWDKFRISMQPGISQEQVEEIYGSLNQAGYGRSSQFNALRDMMVNMVKEFPAMRPELMTASADQTVRVGMTSVDQLNAALEKIPDAAKAAQMGVESFHQALLESGEAAQQAGGTHIQGMEQAAAFSAATGQAPQVGERLFNNPYVQSEIMMQTGLLPNQQRQLPGGVLTDMAGRTARDLYRMYRGTNRNTRTKLPFGAGTIETSGRQADMAMVANELGIPIEQVERMLHPTSQRREKARAGLSTAMEWYDTAVGGINQNKNLSKDEKQRRIAELGGKFNFGKLLSYGGFSEEDRKDILNAKPQDRQQVIEKKMAGKADDERGKYIVDLSPEAKRLFRIKKGGGKDALRDQRDAGGRSPLETAGDVAKWGIDRAWEEIPIVGNIDLPW